jgi:hypothetical protein
MTMPSKAPAAAGESADELIDVVRIRLSNRARATALLSEFQGADRVLAAWAGTPGCSPVDFEITFFDGHVVRGCYEFISRGRPARSFSTHVRRLLRPRDAQAAGAAPVRDLSRYAAPT